MTNLVNSKHNIHLKGFSFSVWDYSLTNNYNMAKVSLDDLAKSLSVSKTLVSMVMNGKGDAHGISKDTQEKVKKKAKELNYIPNSVAQGLRTGKSQLIGLIVPDISNAFFSRLAWQIERMVTDKGYYLMLASSDENLGKEQKLIEIYRNKMVDALIVVPCGDKKAQYESLIHSGIPFVFLDRKVKNVKTSFVGLNNYQGAFDACTELIEAGYENIDMLSITPSHLTNIKDRELGFKDALEKHKISTRARVQTIEYSNVHEDVDKILENRVLSGKTKAIIATNNKVAKKILHLANEKGIRMPEDLALVSFDDIESFTFSRPAISCLAQPIEDLGTEAVKIVFDLIKGNKELIEEVSLPANMIRRASF